MSMANSPFMRAPGMMQVRTRGMGFPRLGGALSGMSGRHFAQGGGADLDLGPQSGGRRLEHMTVGTLLDRFWPSWRTSLGAKANAAPLAAADAPAAGALQAVPGAPTQVVPYNTPSGLTYAHGGSTHAGALHAALQSGAPAQGHVRGPGDGTSDDIDAKLSDGEFVISADVVSHLGNGSNDAGAKKLQEMMDNVRAQKSAGDKFPPKAKNPLSYMKGVKVAKKACGGPLESLIPRLSPAGARDE